MSSLAPRRRRRHAAVALVATSATLTALALLPTAASAVLPTPVDVGVVAPLGADLDSRTGQLAPTSAQKRAASALATSVRWNRFGTPQSLLKRGGFLATGYSTTDNVKAARAFLRAHAPLFRLSPSAVDALELVNDQKMAGSKGSAVLLRQRFGTLTAAEDGMVTVGVVSGKIAYVSSSLVPTTATPAAGTRSAQEAWVAAAKDAGRKSVTADVISGVKVLRGWTTFAAKGFAQAQQARKVALPVLTKGVLSVRPTWEVNVVDVVGGKALAVTSFVDAETLKVHVRRNQVDNATENTPFSGATTATACGPKHPVMIDGDTRTIIVAAQSAIPTNDIVLKLYKGAALLTSSDTATSPEAITYSVPAGTPAGEYSVEVCPFQDPTAPFTAPGDYVGVVTASDTATPSGGVPYPPKWNYFLSNPTPDFSPDVVTDNRKLGCWVTTAQADCDAATSPLNNLAARGPWDYDFRTNTPTFTTEGNAAVTAEAWFSPLTPGGAQRPISPDRVYGVGDATHPLQGFTDAWNDERCNPANFVPGVANNNDVLAATTSLFGSHNRLHDWSYFLGFTESNYNLQDNNFGNRATGQIPTGGELDPEIGNVQAGAVTGGSAGMYLGRDNANQITLQDGTPGITNQYLFQPIAGAFYAPCVDGDLDMSIVGHEYNHAISNRMVGGPDAGLTSFQGGSMGESWGDQIALEYQFENNYGLGGGTVAQSTAAGQNHWVEGVYATGNKTTGIRNYALNQSPLQFGDLGYDMTGPEVHADGEPWSAVMWDVRQALVKKYDGQFPETDFALQKRCSNGNGNTAAPSAPLDAEFCPGNRRWMQLLFDAYLLQPPASSMLDARDAMLAADVMRFGGANQAVMANAFAGRGFGEKATNGPTGGENDQPTPDYTSAYANEGTLSLSANEFTSAGKGAAVKGTLYLGDYEARVTPVADTDGATALPSTLTLVPGTYRFVFQAKGYGLTRFTQKITAGKTVARNVHLAKNLASATSGATVDGASAGSINAGKLLDDTEASNWAGVNPTGVFVDAVNPYVNVDLAGGKQMVRSVKVSALLRPAANGQDESTDMPDDESGSRFTALRDFAIATCTESVTSDCSSPLPAGVPGSPYTVIYNSKTAIGGAAPLADTNEKAAFDSTTPRPLAPNLVFQQFDVPDTEATHVRLIALENQCTGTPQYAGEQDDDPTNDTDCKTASTRGESVRAAELEVFSFDASTRAPGDPVVASTMTAPATVKAGAPLDYTIRYTNAGPQPSAGATITDTLPAGVSFVSASAGSTYDAAKRTVTWKLGTVAVNYTGAVTLRTKVDSLAKAGTVLLNQSQFAGALTFSPPAAAVTTVVP